MKKNQKGIGGVEVFLVIIIIGIIGGTGWYVINTNKKVDKTNSVTASSVNIPSKQVTNAAANKTTIATQLDLELKVNGAQYVNPSGTVTQNSKWFGVNVTLTNNSSNPVSIKNNDFHLKDAQSNEYTEMTIENASTLPDNWTSLSEKTLAPGESLTGTVTFQMSKDSIKSFDFINVTKKYPVKSSN